MKTKAQKRLEAIERLERDPKYWTNKRCNEAAVHESRLREATRLRKAFGLEKQESNLMYRS